MCDSENTKRFIRCIGVDNKQHICLPEYDTCECGVRVKRKELLRDDWNLFTCVKCDTRL